MKFYVSLTIMAILASSFSPEMAMESTTVNCWAWSIHPLIIWLRFLGVDLANVSTASSSYRRWVILVYSLLCLSFHATGQIDILCYVYAKWAPDSLEQSVGSPYDTRTAKLNSMIDFTNYTIHGFGTHIILLTIIRTRWECLKQIFQRFDNVFVDQHYIRIRRMSYFGVVYTILVICGLSSITIYHFASRRSSFHRILVSVMATISAVYPMASLLLFAIHCYASSLAFESIRTDVKRHEIQLMNGQNQDVSKLILLLKEKHILACNTVDGINNSFGWQLLLSMTFYFVSVINSSFYLFGLDNRITVPDVMFFLFVLVNLIVTCVAADCIQNKAEDAMKELLKLKCDEPLKGLQMQQLNSLVSEMAYTIPQISANGYFNVSSKLFPQVIGTTLTYFFILCQFDVSERNLCPK